ncbi:MAG: ATP-binding protein [Rhodocyclaceae bacterium]|nr:ATP-binding protein [Rhodocyclaceae bacterium]MDZ4214916.1 ATP-binding protein [Rhodocyclaceae bacterium]
MPEGWPRFPSPRRWLLGSLRRQLVTGMVLTIAGMLIPFVLWVAAHRATEARHEQVEEAEVFAANLAASSAVWVGASDIGGLRNIVGSFSRYALIQHALITDRQGQVLAHNDASRVGQYLGDLPVVASPAILQQDERLVDVIAPIMLGDSHIGWARIGLDQGRTNEKLDRIRRNGFLFSLVALVIGGLFATYAARRLTRRLTAIEAVAHIQQSGQMARRAQVEGDDEAARLARQFNAMLDVLGKREAELAQSHAELEQRVRERTAELTVSQETLSNLIRSPVLSAGLEVALGYLSEQAASTFNIPRVSIWRLSGDAKTIHCLDLWQATTRQHASGLMLSAEDFPAYFKLIKRDKPIVADDAHTHPGTREFSGGYLTPQGITSMLDVPIHVNGKLWGVMCLEHIGKPRTWAPEHVAFAMGVAALVALSIEKSLRREAEASLLTAKDNAERANAAKSEFLSRMSHELRTPLNAIIGFAQMLVLPGKTPLTEQQADNVQEILKAGQHLLVQVNEVLDLSRIESGRIELSLEPLPLQPLIQDSIAQVQPLAAMRGIVIATQLDDAMALQGDATRVKQVLLNLLSNAIKYNRDGGQIHVTAVATGEQMRVEVRDTGRGIAPEKRERLFKPFERLESSYDGIEGTGIGLALVKRLVEAMGGEIGVDSEAGVGSTFWFVLPVASLPALPVAKVGAGGTAIKADASAATQRRVLYIEDNPANLKLVKKILGTRPNLSLLDAANAELGLEIARRECPDLILLDINLPGMDGFAALATLKSDPATHTIPVIAVTANAMKHDIERGKSAGFADYLTKPLDVPRFMETVAHHLTAKGDQAA